MEPIDELAQLFSRFPGVGKRQSKRFVYSVLRSGPAYAGSLARAIDSLHTKIYPCQDCGRYAMTNNDRLCSICADPERDMSTLVIVEKHTDIEPIESSHVTKGRYFVLGQLVPLVSETSRDDVRIPDLINYIKRHGEYLQEIIFALSVQPEAEQTQLFVTSALRDAFPDIELRFSTLGRGLSSGTEIEYSDTATLENAFKGRS